MEFPNIIPQHFTTIVGIISWKYDETKYTQQVELTYDRDSKKEKRLKNRPMKR